MNWKYRLLISLLFSFSSLTRAQSTIQLFNRKDLSGWYAFEPSSGKHENALEVFKVEKKMIRLYGNKLGYLMTNQSFRDFQLTAEFRWNTDTTFTQKRGKKNSGLMYLIPTEAPDTLWPKGIQFQIKEGGTGDFVLLQEVTIDVKGQKTIPGRSVTSSRFEESEKPIGEWNTLVIIKKNGIIKQELNGKLINEGTNATVTEGRILLQFEGFPIDFKKIILKKF